MISLSSAATVYLRDQEGIEVFAVCLQPEQRHSLCILWWQATAAGARGVAARPLSGQRLKNPPPLSEGRTNAGSAADQIGGLGEGGDASVWALGRSEADGLRLLDPEDSAWYNPARAIEELAQLGRPPAQPAAADLD